MSSTLVEVGKITRLHGFRGAFVIKCDSGQESVLSSVATIAIGMSPDPNKAKFYEIEEASWMPKGWKVKVKDVDTEDAAKAIVNQSVYVRREDFPALSAGEYYVADLVGCDVLDFQTKEKLGILDRVELNTFGHQWWVVRSETDEWFVPNKKSFIHIVDLTKKRIEITLPHDDAT